MTLDHVMIGLAALLALAVTAWFFIGAQWNVKRAHAGLRWLRDGLPLIGARTTMNWMGTTGVTMRMTVANEPFKSAEHLLVIEPRDVVPLWAIAHWRGRRDYFIFRGDLRRHARVEFNLLDVQSWNGKEGLKHSTPKEWTQTPLPGGLLLAAEGPEAAKVARQMLLDLGSLAQHVTRVSVRRTAPHVEIHMTTPWLSGLSSTEVYTAIKNAARPLLP
jgi:hypothetical protein